MLVWSESCNKILGKATLIYPLQCLAWNERMHGSKMGPNIRAIDGMVSQQVDNEESLSGLSNLEAWTVNGTANMVL